MSTLVEIENRAAIARITCGWKKPDLPLDFVRRYWRDVHSPAIARRAGLWAYRHSQFGAVKAGLFKPVPGVSFACPEDQQLMWLSDVRYADQAGLEAFGRSPDGKVKAQLLYDIELLVDQSSTYKAVGDGARTLIDTTGEPMPQGPARRASHSVFFRQHGAADTPQGRAGETALHNSVRALAQRWARTPGVQRVRLNLFEAPDVEAEKRGGYPIKTHPKELQYQAWIELVLDDDGVAATLTGTDDGIDYKPIAQIHAYPVEHLYTFNYAGRPTLAGLRGFMAHEAIERFDARHQRQPEFLQWMYGPAAADGVAEMVAP